MTRKVNYRMMFPGSSFTPKAQKSCKCDQHFRSQEWKSAGLSAIVYLCFGKSSTKAQSKHHRGHVIRRVTLPHIRRTYSPLSCAKACGSTSLHMKYGCHGTILSSALCAGTFFGTCATLGLQVTASNSSAQTLRKPSFMMGTCRNQAVQKPSSSPEINVC